MSLASVINKLSVDDVYLKLIKEITFTGSRSDYDIFLHNVITTHSLSHKYLTLGSLSLKGAMLNVTSYLETPHIESVVTNIQEGLNNGSKNFTVKFSDTVYINIVNETLNITVFSVWQDALDYGYVSYHYGTVGEILASILKLNTGNLCIINNRVKLDKTLISYYNTLKNQKPIYHTLDPLTVDTLDELKLNLLNLRTKELTYIKSSWSNLFYSLDAIERIEQKYYTDAQLVINSLPIGSFERYYLSEMV